MLYLKVIQQQLRCHLFNNLRNAWYVWSVAYGETGESQRSIYRPISCLVRDNNGRRADDSGTQYLFDIAFVRTERGA